MVAISKRLSRFNSCYPIEGGEEVRPGLSLLGKNFSTGGREFVIPAPALPGFFNPPALNPPTRFQAVEQRIQRSYMKLQDAFGALLDELCDFVAVS